MRIIGGAHRGRALASVGKGDAAAHLRPTSDRVRESLFNVLAGGYGDPVTGAHVLDIFAGTGALGLEALSRGAERASFIESGRKALSLLRQNIGLCRAEAVCRVVAQDARKPGVSPTAPHDLVFLDPPYGKGLGEVALAAALAGGWVSEAALIVWEESAAITPPEGMHVIEERRYGDTVIRFLERG
ncbi:ribosomal RNA small subunit methyltransferase D [Roseovarius sp. A-2]|uniref:16S rRNA (guanine(966)-N(2))-methyltransferase RsmD n=1 Tax=Roseovarius sp. A-2 TaxID=1570360 RepID=UPI0009B59049|nr:16S rRNA (guanine(966)-N(2))-methyltransferase RsmD [Roseovarius sp. A-2]GAW33019.1 ribosomal RNA small subunit methyltransferase D [Roseovarius sp. A-2]